MRPFLPMVLLVAVSSTLASSQVRIEVQDKQIAGEINGKPFTAFQDGADANKPYFYPWPVGLARNSFRTPPQKSVDVAVAKQFVLHEGLRAETRVEALNIFNSKNFINVNNTYGEGAAPSPSFLSPLPGISNTDPSPQVQFAVRLLF